MIKRKKQTKAFDVHSWEYKGRKHKIEVFLLNPCLFLFEMGFHLTIDKETWDVKVISRVQKQLRQYLYNYLVANNHPTDSYILALEAGIKPVGTSTFVTLKMACPQLSNMDMNKALCDEITEKMYDILTKI